MEILVNREPLDFRLENESSVGEIVDGLSEWLETGRFAITSLDINRDTYAIHDREAWEAISVNEVVSLSVEALPLHQVDHTTLVALGEYLEILATALREQNVDVLPELREELPYVKRRIAQFVPSLANADGSVDLLEDPALAGGEMPDAATAARLQREIESLRSLLQTREREYRQPERELAVSLGRLSAMSDELIEIPVQLQTGHEGAAMQTVIRLTELLARVVRLVPLVESSGATLEIDMKLVRGFAESMAPHLSELRDAFEIQDTVLVGDLLEYEIAPRLEKLDDLLPGASSAETTP
jgi:hypothetical protein